MPVRDIARKFSFWGFAAAATVVLIVGAGIALSAALEAYSRAEHRYVAEKQVALTHIAISRAKPHAPITRAQIKATLASAEFRIRRTSTSSVRRRRHSAGGL